MDKRDIVGFTIGAILGIVFIVICLISAAGCADYMIDVGCDKPCQDKYYQKYGGMVRGVYVDGTCHCEPVGVKWWKDPKEDYDCE